MSLKYAILGFLNYKCYSGYDLNKKFDNSIGFFYTFTQSQIYRTLEQLLKDRLVEREVIHQENRADKKIYHITDKGKNDLYNWLSTPLDLPSLHLRFLIQIFFARQLSDNEIRLLFEEHRKKLSDKLVILQSFGELEDKKKCGTLRDIHLWKLVLDNGIVLTQAELQWIDAAMKDLKNIPEE